MKAIISAKQGVLELLYKAVHEPIGLKITLGNEVSFKTVRQWFYVAMRKHAPEFDHLVLVNMDEELWIVRNNAEIDDAQSQRTTPHKAHDPFDLGDL